MGKDACKSDSPRLTDQRALSSTDPTHSRRALVPCAGTNQQHIAVGVAAVEARRPDAADDLILTDGLEAVGVGLGDGAADQLVDHLR